MRTSLRKMSNRAFTASTWVSIMLLVGALLVVLGPMLGRGITAVFFRGTVEFRSMQLAMHGRGNPVPLRDEVAQANEARTQVYTLLKRFKQTVGLDRQALADHVRKVSRDYREQLSYRRDLSDEQVLDLKNTVGRIGRRLVSALLSDDPQAIAEDLAYVLAHRDNPVWRATVFAGLFDMAADYEARYTTIRFDLAQKYEDKVAQVEGSLRRLLGPMPDEETPALAMDQYGATRWDLAQRYLKELLWVEHWEQAQSGQMEKRLIARSEQFAGTELEGLFGLVEDNLEGMLRPRRTFYWQYFIDDSTPGHFFGGVGPEVFGTLMLTALAMLFAVPLGIVAAAYLVECAGDTLVVRMIRTCVNTLAGVPSIVFGLFGLAFFVRYVMPQALKRDPTACVLTGAMTLAILVLPVIIRASEEAIRTVPRAYKEAALALGAGRFWTFVTVTLPAALPGILTGIILSLSRAAGETAPLLFTGAISLGPVPKSVFQGTRALSTGCYDIAVTDRLSMMVPHKQYGMVMTLIVLVLCLNLVAILLRSRASKKLRGQ